MPPKHTETAAIVTKAYDLVLWLLPKVEGFSRTYRHMIGDRLTSHGLDLLLLLVQASYASDKIESLRQANEKVNGIRYLLRLAKDLHVLSLDSYGFAAEKLDEIGRMAGGWLKAAVRPA